VYQKGELYVRVSVSFDPRDAPFGVIVYLDEGGINWPDWDWNSVALWRLIKLKFPNRHVAGKEPYPVDSPSNINDVLPRICSDLEQFAQDFLTGELAIFKKARAEQNRGRRPYLIHRPGPDGRYITEIEPESQKLLERYSKEA
ncbi:MAG TPA: hypothetical protein VFW40_07075, partial [Capsulimonadaceae bacterium]|nr:hypothetical protein [Capsulimonadaceae bacterium]